MKLFLSLILIVTALHFHAQKNPIKCECDLFNEKLHGTICDTVFTDYEGCKALYGKDTINGKVYYRDFYVMHESSDVPYSYRTDDQFDYITFNPGDTTCVSYYIWLISPFTTNDTLVLIREQCSFPWNGLSGEETMVVDHPGNFCSGVNPLFTLQYQLKYYSAVYNKISPDEFRRELRKLTSLAAAGMYHEYITFLEFGYDLMGTEYYPLWLEEKKIIEQLARIDCK